MYSTAIQDLSGVWQCSIPGMSAPVTLPGTLDESGIGFPDENKNKWHPDAAVNEALRKNEEAKAATMNGNYVYVLPNESMYKRVSTPSTVREMMSMPGFVSINFSGNMAVIKTRPGYASSIAWNIDNSSLPQLLGTIAGADTIFIVLKEGIPKAEIIDALSTVIPNMK